MDIKALLLGPNKYTTGIVFLLANMMGFFAKMKENDVNTMDSFSLLTVVTLIAYAMS